MAEKKKKEDSAKKSAKKTSDAKKTTKKAAAKIKTAVKKKKTDKKKKYSCVNKMAKKYDLVGNHLFESTYKRYEEEIELADCIITELNKDGYFTMKEYVKGRPNLCYHPGIDAYNKTVDTANKTAQALCKIIETLGNKELEKKDEDELLNALSV